MTPKQKANPTNADIYRKLDGVSNRVTTLEEWKRGLDIAKQAVDEYKKDETANRTAQQKRELLKQAGIVLALIAGVLYIFLESHGIKP